MLELNENKTAVFIQCLTEERQMFYMRGCYLPSSLQGDVTVSCLISLKPQEYSEPHFNEVLNHSDHDRNLSDLDVIIPIMQFSCNLGGIIRVF